MIRVRIVCPHCHSPLSSAELEHVTISGRSSLLCPECSVVLVSERVEEAETHALDEHFADVPLAHG